MRIALTTVLVVFLGVSAVPAREFFVDPVAGDPANDGSAEKPWKSLAEVVAAGGVESRAWESLPYKPDVKLVPRNPGAPVKPGDTIFLRDGYHGELTLQGLYNAGPITIAAEEGHTPRFRSVRIRAGANWVLRGLHVSPEFGPGEKPATLIALESHGWHGPVSDIVVEDCIVRSAEDAGAWSADDWNRKSCNGIDAAGTNVTVRRCLVKNVNFGISLTASRSLVEHNVVENFAGDGLRGLGDYAVFQYNLVKNCYDVNANHDDGFQSWSRGPDGVGSGEVVGIVLRGNTIINYEDPNQPHRGTLQGIGCFDGTFVDWVIENNVVVVDHWHGITLLGARGCRIVNNTVVDPNGNEPGPPWIRVGKHKKGTPPADCILRNNLAASVGGDEGENMVVDHNLPLKDLDAVFVDAAAGDLRLRRGSPAIDAGAAELAPETDVAGTARPQGRAVDLGAYEYTGE